MAELPEYRNILTPMLNLPRDMAQSYTGVITQIYPLLAEQDKLQKFCDSYLNFNSEKGKLPFYFELAAPFVILQVAHYENISAPDINLSFAQNEVAFGFPVKWYDVTEAGETFRDWFMLYPFIFVDDAYSRLSARQEYGWAKAAVRIDASLPNLDLDEPATLVSVSRYLYPVTQLRAARVTDYVVQPTPEATQQPVPFLQVYQKRPFATGIRSVSEAMVAMPRAIGMALEVISAGSKAIGSVLSGARDITQLLGSLPMLNQFYQRMSQSAPLALGVLGLRGKQDPEPMPVKVVTVKQFRDTEDSNKATYTAVVGSEMQLCKVHDAGALFDALSPDLSGGIDIKILCPREKAPAHIIAKLPQGAERVGSRWAESWARSWPESTEQPDPVEQLGLAKTGYAQIGDSPAYLLRPLLPGWTKVDFSYSSANKQYWRTKTLDWQDSNDPKAPKVGLPPNDYNRKHGSGGLSEQQGPFTYDPFVARMIFLRADKDRLQSFVREYLSNDIYKFTVHTHQDWAWVWVIMASFTFKGTFTDRSMLFAVPGRLTQKQGGKSVSALFSAYQFTNSDWHYITENEVFGRFTLISDLDSPPSLWMDHGLPGSAPKQTLLTVTSHIFVPEGHDKVERRKTIATVTGATQAQSPDPATMMDTYGIADYVNNPYFVTSLKQVVDAQEGDRAAYQELVGVEAKLTTAPGFQSALRRECIELTLEQKRPDYDLLPIVRNLGLDKFSTTTDAGGCCFAPTGGEANAVVLTGKLEIGVFDPSGKLQDEPVGRTLAWRVGTGAWHARYSLP